MAAAAGRRNRALIAWYRAHGRELPWRSTTDPWAILVSEVMLQQTQVGRVVGVFGRFLTRFPTPASLAGAASADLITAWEDLGYLKRAFNLRQAAAIIAADGWPAPDDLEQLPGVGPYTAAAVATFGFGARRPAVDTNLRRVLSRWEGRPLGGRELMQAAERALDGAHADDWNQAMMDLGAVLCRPRHPACGACPVAEWCRDHTVTVALPAQSAFTGSIRQARAAVLKTLAASGAIPRRQVARMVDLAPAVVEQAVEALLREGTVRIEEDSLRLP